MTSAPSPLDVPELGDATTTVVGPDAEHHPATRPAPRPTALPRALAGALAPAALLLDTEPVSVELLGPGAGPGSSWLVRVVLTASSPRGSLVFSQLLEMGTARQRDWARALAEFPFSGELRLGGDDEPLLVVRRGATDARGDQVEHVVGLTDHGSAPTARVSFATTALPLTFAAHALELLEEAQRVLPSGLDPEDVPATSILPRPLGDAATDGGQDAGTAPA